MRVSRATALTVCACMALDCEALQSRLLESYRPLAGILALLRARLPSHPADAFFCSKKSSARCAAKAIWRSAEGRRADLLLVYEGGGGAGGHADPAAGG